MWWHTGKCLNVLGGTFRPSQIKEVPAGEYGRSWRFIRQSPVKSTRLAPVNDESLQSLCPRPGDASLQTTRRDGENHKSLEAFKVACKNRYRNLSRAWQLLLDPEFVGRISFVPFHRAARIMGFHDARLLWSAIDTDQSGFITLDEWDTRTFRHLAEFRDICFREYGGIEHAFVHGMDHTGSRTVTLPELKRFCDDTHFSGDVKMLMAALDLKMDGYISEDELPILLSINGERYGRPKIRMAGERIEQVQGRTPRLAGLEPLEPRARVSLMLSPRIDASPFGRGGAGYVRMATLDASPRGAEHAGDLRIDFRMPELAKMQSQDLALF